jgi:flagellar hook-associated protein 1 FlgK
MSGLFSNLYTNTSAMRAHTAALDLVGRNMANVNNPAYARQRIIYGDRGAVQTALGTQSLGIEAVGIQQFRDRLLDGQIRNEISTGDSFSTRLAFLRQAETALGQGALGASGGLDTIGSNPTIGAGIAQSIDAFFNAWESFATHPTSIIEKQQVAAATDDLINKLQLADARLADIALPSTRNSLTDQMDRDATRVNGLLASIADLNRQIGRVEVSRPLSAVDLRDQRQAKLEELARLIDFEIADQPAGQIAIVVRDTANNAVNLVDLANVPGTFARNGTGYEWTPTAGPAVALNVTGGSLHGYREAGLAIQGYRDDLDAFVGALVAQVNTAYNSGTNGEFFAAGGTTAASIARVATVSNLRAADIGSPAGANDRALAVAEIARHATFLHGTPAATFTRLVGEVAQDITVAGNRLEDQASLQRLLKAQREAFGGVSLDEEVAEMMRLQRAFQASAKLINVMDEMLDRVVNGLVRA